MSITTNQQITNFFELYKNIDVTFTKEMILVSGLLTNQCFFKCVGEQWPCIIYSTSFIGAKILASIKPTLYEKIKKANNIVSLRYSFKLLDKTEPLTFFIAGKVLGFSPYQNSASRDLQYISIQYTNRPPDPLIEIMGKILEANINSAKRRDDRILLTTDTIRKIGLAGKDTTVLFQNIPRKCILRDLSFSGAKIIIVGIAKFLLQKECMLRIDMLEPRSSYLIKGVVVRNEEIEGRKDLVAIAIKFDMSSVPIAYKMHINEYLLSVRKNKNEDVPTLQAE